ncbi:MAG TPA: radical SAM protein, partial [Thermoanaerobaculia bacterium]|nr:radical SAM protein [Thermoanaerobaculia bacterium]
MSAATGYARLRQLVRERGALHEATLELTYRCNLACEYCYNDKRARGKPLSLAQYLALLRDLAAMNVLYLTFTGGEPLLHPDLFALGRAAVELGFVTRLRTNGHLLAGELVERLRREVDPYLVDISLHGATAATHDRQTRVPGSFARLVDNVEGLVRAGQRTQLVCTPTVWNQDELPAMLDLADRLGVRLRFQGPVVPRDDGDLSPLALNPSAEVWDALQAELRRRDAALVPLGARQPQFREPVISVEGEGQCSVGSEEVVVDPFGNVLPCLHVRWPAGNLHEQAIAE